MAKTKASGFAPKLSSKKDLESLGAKRYSSIAPLSLGGVKVAFIDRLTRPQPFADEVDIPPPEGKEFTNPQTGKPGEPTDRLAIGCVSSVR